MLCVFGITWALPYRPRSRNDAGSFDRVTAAEVLRLMQLNRRAVLFHITASRLLSLWRLTVDALTITASNQTVFNSRVF